MSLYTALLLACLFIFAPRAHRVPRESVEGKGGSASLARTSLHPGMVVLRGSRDEGTPRQTRRKHREQKLHSTHNVMG
jgi:hypothetical protein